MNQYLPPHEQYGEFSEEPIAPLPQSHALIDFALNPQSENIGDPRDAANYIIVGVESLQANPESAAKFGLRQLELTEDEAVPKLFCQTRTDLSDTSKLQVTISLNLDTPPPKTDPISRDDRLYMAVTALGVKGSSDMSRAEYTIPRLGESLLCETDRDHGAKIQATMDTVDAIDVSDFSKGKFEAVLGTLMLEGMLQSEGLDPDLDSDVAELREIDDDYKVISDGGRNEIATRQLEQQLGIQPGKRAVGMVEARALMQLLRSFHEL